MTQQKQNRTSRQLSTKAPAPPPEETAAQAPEGQAPEAMSQAPEGQDPEAAGQDRSSRDADARGRAERPTEWRPPHMNEEITHTPEWIFRWIRVYMDGEHDHRNVEKKLREGYELVAPEDPMVREQVERGELRADSGRVMKGGLALAKMPRELADQRNEYYTGEARLHQQHVNQALNNVRHHSMPVGVQKEERSVRRES